MLFIYKISPVLCSETSVSGIFLNFQLLKFLILVLSLVILFIRSRVFVLESPRIILKSNHRINKYLVIWLFKINGGCAYAFCFCFIFYLFETIYFFFTFKIFAYHLKWVPASNYSLIGVAGLGKQPYYFYYF